ncbi:MAG: extracellular solute-binding protein, partial [Anaerolineales bacterium]
MKRSSLWQKLLVFLFIAILVAGCQPSAPPTSEAQPPAASGETQPPPAGEASQPPAAGGEKVTLTIESWRNDDLPIWQDVIIPAFEAKYPNIHVVFAPTAPAEYNGVLNSKLEAGTAGDLITCRPFDASLKLYEKGYLAPLNDLPGMENFTDFA